MVDEVVMIDDLSKEPPTKVTVRDLSRLLYDEAILMFR